jgi:hypothetical protein
MALAPQTTNDLAALALKLAGNPKTRAKFTRMVQEVSPSYRLPADVQLQEFEARSKREREEEKIRERAERAEERRTQARQGLINSGRYTEDQVVEIEAVMKKHGLPSDKYDAGAKLYGADISPARPNNANQPMRHGQIWEFPNIPGLLQNPEKAASDAAYAVIDEMRAGR